ncbi:MAG TPA: hypothetical protein VKD91_05700 [Pyrinomonadaceae bacterium]|nr:hypothetical protein [Pyrinomonadaceae bacterium]
MKRWFAVPLVAAIIAASSPSVSAQWPLYPQPGVPKGPDGKPDVNAPAPRTADGKPDFSGIWIRFDDPETNGPPADRPPLVKGGDAGAGFKGGLPFQPWAAELQKKRSADSGLNDPDGLCLPQGPLQYHIDPQPIKIIQTPRQILYMSESNYGLRTIYMDGRSLPAQGSVQPYWHGYSVGHWDGDALVIESNNFHGVDPANVRAVGLPDVFLGAGWLDHRGSPYTEAMKLTERFRRVNFGKLDIELTVDDPKAYTKPFTVRVAQRIVADGSEMIEFICHENQTFLKLTGREHK